jgi:hypothetical protein
MEKIKNIDKDSKVINSEKKESKCYLQVPVYAYFLGGKKVFYVEVECESESLLPNMYMNKGDSKNN